MTLTPALFARAGRALFGDEWQVPTARLLGINERTVRRIAQAEREGRDYRMTEAWGPELVHALRARAEEAKLQASEAAAIAGLLAG